MIKASSRQTGSAHVIVIVLLISALVGALGFIFWQNFTHKEPATIQKNTSNSSQEVNAKAEASVIKVDENDYTFTVVEGFSESTEQQFTYTGSLKAAKTFVNKESDYFEILTPYGGGGGISGDYFWSYDVQDGKVALDKKPRCTENNSFCFAGNGSVEGIISNSSDTYYFAFGNKTKNEMNIDYVDKFISTVKFKNWTAE